MPESDFSILESVIQTLETKVCGRETFAYSFESLLFGSESNDRNLFCVAGNATPIEPKCGQLDADGNGLRTICRHMWRRQIVRVLR
ncbi:hypothetical protein FOB41_23995 [Agrobacterium pusense]|uniref:Uncharacterized protein n=1 Tax=Agrobacterium pusense TaxID=648995 RepID=A0A6H0ZVM6_9HYPH|nr:hypothetical protein [Agrobacterium pusense]QIX24167.1 hypothetical protein FOB41_23995 [Agrobacterium pusense]